jgi:hypothetical protein
MTDPYKEGECCTSLVSEGVGHRVYCGKNREEEFGVYIYVAAKK